jgi:hypothetical protein
MNTNYGRVLPRDLFNEAKLLKCIGKLVLNIHDGNVVNGTKFEHDGEGFVVGLNNDGTLEINNIDFTINGTSVRFVTTYNSKDNWPLFCWLGYCEYPVFDEAGEYTEEFIEFANAL